MQLQIQLTTTVYKRKTVNGNIDNDLIQQRVLHYLLFMRVKLGLNETLT